MYDTTINSKPCPGCHETVLIQVRRKDYLAWKNGELIHKAFSYLTREQRERLISGYCDPCWDKLFLKRTTNVPEDGNKWLT